MPLARASRLLPSLNNSLRHSHTGLTAPAVTDHVKLNATTELNMKTQLNHRWLVVDDDPTVLELTTEVLRSVLGSEVVACGDSRRALEVFFAEPEAFELVITDFNMPGLDGLEFARAVHERSPQMKI